MLQNLLLIASDFKNINIENFELFKGAKKFRDKINSNPGYLFLVDKKRNVLRISKIDKIRSFSEGKSKVDNINNFTFSIQNHEFEIQLKNDFQYIPIETLKMVYSKKQIKEIGNENHSIYSTMKIGEYKFSTPTIHNLNLFKSILKKNKFKEKLLYNNSIFSAKNEGEIYGQFLEEDGEVFFSLTNKKMLKEDLSFIITKMENMDYTSDYRPYFYEFYLTDNLYLNKTRNLALEIGEIYEVEINKDHEDEGINGELVFSASPVITELANLKITNKLTKREKKLIKENEDLIKSKIISIDNKVEIEESIMKNFTDWKILDFTFEVTVLNVGKGNWINVKVINEKDEKIDIVFDIGIGNSSNPQLIKTIASRAASELDEKHIFILSHWDLDHIKGIRYLTDLQFETTWVVPELPKSASFAALRLASYLKFQRKIDEVFVSGNLNNQLIFKNKLLMLGKGQGLDIGANAQRNGHSEKVSYNSNNNLGLLLSVGDDKGKTMLLAGDCEYIQFPSEFLKSYSTMVISHHGAKINVANLQNIGLLPSKYDSKAIVCVGKENCYPNNEHKKSIENLGYDLIETRTYSDIYTQLKVNF